jgi:hypothetical protein
VSREVEMRSLTSFSPLFAREEGEIRLCISSSLDRGQPNRSKKIQGDFGFQQTTFPCCQKSMVRCPTQETRSLPMQRLCSHPLHTCGQREGVGGHKAAPCDAGCLLLCPQLLCTPAEVDAVLGQALRVTQHVHHSTGPAAIDCE